MIPVLNPWSPAMRRPPAEPALQRCEECPRSFRPYRRGQRFCGPRCRDRFKQRQMRARAKQADPAELARLRARIAELEARIAELEPRS
jgi:hypothetical protein